MQPRMRWQIGSGQPGHSLRNMTILRARRRRQSSIPSAMSSSSSPAAFSRACQSAEYAALPTGTRPDPMRIIFFVSRLLMTFAPFDAVRTEGFVAARGWRGLAMSAGRACADGPAAGGPVVAPRPTGARGVLPRAKSARGWSTERRVHFDLPPGPFGSAGPRRFTRPARRLPMLHRGDFWSLGRASGRRRGPFSSPRSGAAPMPLLRLRRVQPVAP